MRATIVDSSAIIALFDEDSEQHQEVAKAVQRSEGSLVVSPFVVAETDYMLYRRVGRRAAAKFNDDVALGAFELASWTTADHAEALQVVRSFPGGDYIGATDASNVVLADRYRTTDIMTLDYRRFRRLRPIWGPDYFNLLPLDEVG
ncbi:PIN domain-containing protein [Glycomyces arizonensis]|uniref:PIN domain-containing protein n=1 Tax=Glycomyces arizonensis TaxID=256035 RepID=UPI0005532209|nr:PIN domain-containing protein [Glycomyces arizonensis]